MSTMVNYYVSYMFKEQLKIYSTSVKWITHKWIKKITEQDKESEIYIYRTSINILNLKFMAT